MSSSIYDYQVEAIDHSQKSLADFRGKVLLIVNTASKCGFTPQYEGLEKLYRQYHEKGFEVLGFPCNQFLNQEPGNEEQIQQFCSLNYDVTFPMFARVEVNGSGTAPLFRFLKKKAPGLLGSESIKWNFTKFLVDRNGKVVRRYATAVTPEQISSDIEALLNA